jgi:hypothetical protein
MIFFGGEKENHKLKCAIENKVFVIFVAGSE